MVPASLMNSGVAGMFVPGITQATGAIEGAGQMKPSNAVPSPNALPITIPEALDPTAKPLAVPAGSFRNVGAVWPGSQIVGTPACGGAPTEPDTTPALSILRNVNEELSWIVLGELDVRLVQTRPSLETAWSCWFTATKVGAFRDADAGTNVTGAIAGPVPIGQYASARPDPTVTDDAAIVLPRW